MTDDLSEFLLARIDEAEAMAKAATPGPWQWDCEEFTDEPCPHNTMWTDHGPDLISTKVGEDGHPLAVLEARGYDASSLDVKRSNADHIAYWDPTRVLAECEAKRRIIAGHAAWPRNRRSDHGTPDCMTCIENRDAWETSYELYPCPTLRYLASPYADYPGYRQEWKP